ncbi:MAG: hypothetical protein KJ927_13370, partial [Candidatus Eisenbacteria bacterium]|nr:hypothetical protein [Candidatus Eisenbacteria bacterium]
AFLIRFKELQRSFFDLLLVSGGAFLAFVITNPYVLIHPEQYHLTIVQLGSAEGPGHAVFEIKKGLMTLRDFFFRSYSFPLAFAGAIGAVIHLIRKPEPLIPSHLRGDSRRHLPILKKPRAQMPYHGETKTIRREPSPRNLREPSYLRRLAVTWLILLLTLSFTNGRVRHMLFLGPIACLLIGDALNRFIHHRGRIPGLLKSAVGFLLFIPGIYFTILFAGDVIQDDRWMNPTREWVESANLTKTTTPNMATGITAQTTLGFFDRPDPVYHPPIPFLGSRILNLHEYRNGETDPDYVILGNFFDDRESWENHPLYSHYRLARDLGDKASLHRFLFFRTASQSRMTGWIYERLPINPDKGGSTPASEDPN